MIAKLIPASRRTDETRGISHANQTSSRHPGRFCADVGVATRADSRCRSGQAAQHPGHHVRRAQRLGAGLLRQPDRPHAEPRPAGRARDRVRAGLHQLAAVRALAAGVHLRQVRLARRRLEQRLPAADERLPVPAADHERGRLRVVPLRQDALRRHLPLRLHRDRREHEQQPHDRPGRPPPAGRPPGPGRALRTLRRVPSRRTARA